MHLPECVCVYMCICMCVDVFVYACLCLYVYGMFMSACIVEPRFNDLWYNDILGITINNRLPSKSYSKMYGAESRYNDLRHNDIPGLTMGMSLTERKIFPVITVKST